MLQIHPNARTTPAVRAEVARSGEATGVLVRRFGVSTETIRKWRKRGPQDCLDRSARPHTLPWKATEEERAVVCALRRATRFALDDLTFVVAHFLPHLNRDSVWRILRAGGAEPQAAALLGQAREGPRHLQGLRPRLRAHRHQAPAQAAGRQRRAAQAPPLCRHRPPVALRPPRGQGRRDREERHRRPSASEAVPRTLREAAAAFPFRLTHVLTDNGSCFTPAFARVCAELGAEYRHTRPYSPYTNGMVERFNGRIGSEVLGITIYSHAQLEQLLRGFNAAYNRRRQRVLDGKTPNQVTAEGLKARRKLANPKPQGRAGPEDIAKARLIAEAAKEVSQPDNRYMAGPHGGRSGVQDRS